VTRIVSNESCVRRVFNRRIGPEPEREHPTILLAASASCVSVGRLMSVLAALVGRTVSGSCVSVAAVARACGKRHERLALVSILGLACVSATFVGVAVAQAPNEPAAETSSGETEAQARALFERGLAAAEAGAHADALIHFERSFELVPRASTAFNVAVQHARLGRPTAALRALDSLHELSPSEADGRDADALRVRLRASLATLVLRVAPPSATVSVDGAVVPGVGAERTLVLDPGARRIEVRADDHEASRRSITLLAGATAEERFDLVPRVSLDARALAPDAEPRSRRARRVAIALSVVVVVAGAVALGAWLGRPDPLPRDSFPDS